MCTYVQIFLYAARWRQYRVSNFTISPAKMNGSKPNLARRNYVTKGTHKKIWGLYHACDFLSVHVSPVRLVPLEPKRPPISASNHVILLLIYAHRQKFWIFTRRRRGIEKVRFSGFLGWVFCRSATAYIEHQICTLKARIISGDGELLNLRVELLGNC